MLLKETLTQIVGIWLYRVWCCWIRAWRSSCKINMHWAWRHSRSINNKQWHTECVLCLLLTEPGNLRVDETVFCLYTGRGAGLFLLFFCWADQFFRSYGTQWTWGKGGNLLFQTFVNVFLHYACTHVSLHCIVAKFISNLKQIQYWLNWE